MMQLRFSFIKLISMLTLAVVLSASLMTTSAAAPDATFTSALWIAEDNGVLKVTTSDGNVLFEIKDIDKVKAVATDGQHGRLWVATSSIITAYNFAGEQLLKTALPFKFKAHKMNEVMMTVDEQEGSIWLLDKKKLIKLDAEGNVTIQKYFPQKIESISFDNKNRRLWLIHKGAITSVTEHKEERHHTTVSSIDSVTGEWVSSFSPSPKDKLHLGVIHYDENLNELWFLENNSLVRYDIDGNITFTGTIKPFDKFKLDGKGNVWASKKETLYYISDSDSILFQVNPFPDKHNKISYIVVNPTDQSVWVASHNDIVNYSNEGLEKHRLTIKKKINGLAIYSDTYAPTLSLVSPAIESITNVATPAFVFNLQDIGVGANPSSIEIISNNLVIPTSCVLDSVTNNATCTVTQTLTDGLWDFTATVKDYVGNVSQKISVSFTVDTISPAITVTSHWNGAYVNQSAQALSGYLSELASLDINGLTVTLGLNHTFTYPVLLLEGQNNFLLTAKDEATNVGTFSLVLFLDSIPPAAVNVEIVIATNSINGESTLTGQVGAVEADAIVEVTNLTTNVVTTVQANTDGSFSLVVQANPNDKLNIVVIDKAGNRSELRVIDLTPPLSISITSPVDLSSVQSDSINIEGTFKGPAFTGITINGEVAAIINNKFYINNINLQPGVNTVTAYLSIPDGTTTQHAISITSNAPSVYDVDVEPYLGINPLLVNFNINETQLNSTLPSSIKTVNVDFESDGIIDYTSTDLTLPIQFTYTLAGKYTATTTVFDTNGVSHTYNNHIIVEDSNAMDLKLRSIYTGMLEKLSAGKISQAMDALTGAMRAKFETAFINTSSKLATLIPKLGTIAGGALINGNLAEYVITRTENGQQVAFAIYLVKGRDGVWRIGEM